MAFFKVVSLALALMMIAELHPVDSTRNPYKKTEAEDFDYGFGVTYKFESNADNDCKVTGTDIGDVVGYYGYSFDILPVKMSIRYSRGREDSRSTGLIKVRLNSIQSKPVAIFELPYTSNWTTYATVDKRLDLSHVKSLINNVDVFFEFSSTIPERYENHVGDLDSFVFSG